MKKFKFSLERMRSYKDSLLDEEKNTLAKLNMAVRELEQRIKNIDEEFARLSRQMLEEEKVGVEARKLYSYNNQLAAMRLTREELEKELVLAQEAVDKQMDIVLAASQEVSKLDKLEERQLEEYNKEMAKAEADLIEELVSSDSIRKEIS